MAKSQNPNLAVKVNRILYVVKSRSETLPIERAENQDMQLHIVNSGDFMCTTSELGFLVGKKIGFLYFDALHVTLRTSEGDEIEVWWR